MNQQIAGWITHRWAKWVVLVLTLSVVLGLAMFASKLTGAQENDIAAFLPGDAESTKVIERTAEFADDEEMPAIVAYVREDGITAGDLQAVLADAEELTRLDDVVSVVSPALLQLPPDQQAALDGGALSDLTPEQVSAFTSEDGQAVQLFVTVRVDSTDGWERLPDLIGEIRDVVDDTESEGLTAWVGGPAAFGADQSEAFAGIDGILLLAAVAVVVIMLLLTYRSPVLWLIPLICGVLSVGAAQGVVYLLAEYADLTVNGQSAGILAVLVLGAGIDYALLLVARYREELRRYADRHEAMAHALHRAAPAILASGATVIIGLLCLTFAELNSTSGLGPVAAAGIVVSLALMLILLPVLLVIFGRWVFWPFIPHFGDPEPSQNGIWSRVGRRISHRPRAVWVVTVGLLAACTIGIVQLDANGLSNADSFTTSQPSIEADEVIAEHFPAGEGQPLQIVANADRAADVATALEDVDGLEAAAPGGNPAEGPTGVVQGDTVYFERTLTDASDSPAAAQTVERARDAVHDVDGADALVGGMTAIVKDVQDASSHDNLLIIPIILVVVLVILGLLLRAIVAPLILLGTVVLSFGAAVGISALVFRHIFGFEGADTSFPLFAFVFLVALGIDYNIFLMTRVREETLQHGTRKGALIGLAATGGVITSAGLVLAGTFSALATLPIVFLAELGFVVALGVLLDTIVVRSVLVTALNLDIGRWMWWPSALWRTDGPDHLADDHHPADPVAVPAGHEPEHRA